MSAWEANRTGALTHCKDLSFFRFFIAFIISLQPYPIPLWTKTLAYGPEHPKTDKPLQFISLKEKIRESFPVSGSIWIHFAEGVKL